MSRIYIFTGKGGVGKTSVAAAHGVKSAEDGYRTLLVSTDMAHNLGDLFSVSIEKEPVEIIKNLEVYEIDPNYVMEHDFKEMILCLGKIVSFSNESVENFGMFPGMEELFSLLKIAEVYKEGTYDRIIVDCAPTGETLSLLKFPELLSWYMEKLFPIGKLAVKMLAPISKTFFKVELPNKAAMTDIEKMYLKLYELQELLKNREVTSIRLVTIPEKMVVEETKRNYMYMNLYNFNVDGLYINRILPGDIENSFFQDWLQIQKAYLLQLEESFAALPIYRIPWYDEELRGIKAVKRICKDTLSTEKVFDMKVITQRENFEKNENGYLLTVSVPYAKKEELDLYQSDTDVVVKLGNFKRNIPLPNVLRTYSIASAKLEDGLLKLQFERGNESNE
ncbi:ArsA family ATPase [Anaeromicropila populeti]|uniref:arsenite-transporting ATPase n=1 Tax=Anaeromicropila populeti TaxID=37658 RepID=A0A1I6HY94_9FIRM|nr:ArsA family ATPase [Anaeromicropila populeti]SFR59413.1 arsenite-transporting ATPase [Anaeromicropila populeti]